MLGKESLWRDRMSKKNPAYLRYQAEIVDVETGPKPSPTPDPDNYPRINTCCPCMECLDDCIKQTESGGEGSPVTNPGELKPNPDHTGCDAPATGCDTGLGCDCGPYQIDHQDYVHDICGPVGPCSNGDGGYDNSCCEVCEPGYGEALCEPCGNNAACCEEKDRRSRKLMDCWRRRYTRNPSGKCKGTGPTIHPTDPDSGPCFTCQDIARMHNGGPCGHKRKSTERYWNKVRACMARKCGFSRDSDGSESCTDLEVNKRNESRGRAGEDNVELNRQFYWEQQSKKKL